MLSSNAKISWTSSLKLIVSLELKDTITNDVYDLLLSRHSRKLGKEQLVKELFYKKTDKRFVLVL
jgi:hypothetical protein